jgi:hypothetical protein
MTPQDKAKKLFQLFGTAIAETVDDDGFICNTEQAKQCALICVQQLIENDLIDDYWFQVKEEIENL